METYTVLETGTYIDSVTGGQFKYFEGDIVTIETAVRFGMPGAELPADPIPFQDVQLEYLDETYASESAADSRLLVANGTFADNAEGWAASNDETILWQETNGASSDGTGCMTFNRLAGTAHVAFAPDGVPVPLNGIALLNFSVWVLSGHADITFLGRLGFYADATYDNFISNENIPQTGTPAAVTGSYVQHARYAILVPAGATHVDISLLAVGLDDTDPILVDNVAVWGTP